MSSISVGYVLVTKIILLIFGMMAHMCTGLIAPAIPKILRSYSNLPNIDFLVKLLATIPHLSIAISSPLIGSLVYKINRKISLVSASLAYVFVGIVCFYAESIYVIIACRAILGVAVSLIVTVVTSLIADCFSGPERNTMIGLQTAFMSMGTICFSLLSGILADLNWRYVFLCYIFPSIILIPCAIFFLFDPRRGGPLIREAKNRVQVASLSEVVIVHGLPLMFMVYGLSMLHIMVHYLIPLQLPVLLDNMGQSAKRISYIISAETFIVAIVATFYRRFKQHRGHLVICLASLLAMAIGLVCIGSAHTYLQIMAACILYGAGMGLMMPNNVLWVISLVKAKDRGVAIGGLTTSTYLGKFLGGFLVYFLSQHFPASGVYIIGAIILLCMIPAIIILNNFIKKKPYL